MEDNGSLGENSTNVCIGEKTVEAIHGMVYSSREDLKFPAAQMRSGNLSKGNGQVGWNSSDLTLANGPGNAYLTSVR